MTTPNKNDLTFQESVAIAIWVIVFLIGTLLNFFTYSLLTTTHPGNIPLILLWAVAVAVQFTALFQIIKITKEPSSCPCAKRGKCKC